MPFHIALQEFAFEVAEEPFAVQGIIGGDDAAAGDGIDDIDLVEQPSASAPDPELHVAQRFHRSVGQCRRPRASARQRQDDQHVAWIVGIGFDALQPVSLGQVLARDRRAHRGTCVTPDQSDRAKQKQPRQPAGAGHHAQ